MAMNLLKISYQDLMVLPLYEYTELIKVAIDMLEKQNNTMKKTFNVGKHMK